MLFINEVERMGKKRKIKYYHYLNIRYLTIMPMITAATTTVTIIGSLDGSFATPVIASPVAL